MVILNRSAPPAAVDMLTSLDWQVHGEAVYQFGAAVAPLWPFVTAGFGVSVLTAPDLTADTSATWSVGGGLKWFAAARIGIQGQIRYAPTLVLDSSSSSSSCQPFGFCQSTLRRFDIGGGVIVRW